VNRIKNGRIKSDRIKSGRIKSDRIKTDRIKSITDPTAAVKENLLLWVKDTRWHNISIIDIFTVRFYTTSPLTHYIIHKFLII
jgi:hypothetical protein